MCVSLVSVVAFADDESVTVIENATDAISDEGSIKKSTYIIKDETSARELEALGVRVVMFDEKVLAHS